MGPFGSSIKVETFVDQGVPVISGQHLNGSRLDDAVGYNFITPEHADRLKNANVQRGDVIFTHAGSIGQVAYIPANSKYERYVISQRQFYLRPDPSLVLPEFIVAYFKTPEGQHKLLANTSQVGVPSIAQPVTYLRTIEIPLPPFSEQRAIAHILGTLDDKIELNRRMSETLEAMARALFKAWFVDFEPVRAKMEGRWRRGESLSGLPAHLYDLFPDRLVESELGEIPEGWEVGCFGDLCKISSGKRPSSRFSNPSKDTAVPLWGGNGPMGFVPESMTNEPILLTGRVGTLGSVFRITTPCWPSDNTLILRANHQSAFEYLFLQLQLVDFESLNRGSTQPLLTQSDLKAQRLLLPPSAVLDHFSALTAELYRRIDENNAESRTLAALRDALLPKLISGELRVKDAEKFIGRATA
jgi:type I restriction enzyme S subunit